MNAVIIHESRGRMRLQCRLKQKEMSLRQADLLEAWFQKQSWTSRVTVHERTGCVILYYTGARETVLQAVRQFSWKQAEQSVSLPAHSSRMLNRQFEEKLVGKAALKLVSTLFLPTPLRIARVLWHAVPFLRKGLRCLRQNKIKVELLDAVSIGLSIIRRDFATAGSVMFLLELGELLEEWTRKKSVQDLAQCMSLNVDRVWLNTPEGEVLTPVSQIRPGDRIAVRVGGVIPVDGMVTDGEAMVNQASLTGESLPAAKRPGSLVYAGTTIAEGACTIEVPANFRPEPLRPDRGHDRAFGADEVGDGKQGCQSGGQTGAIHLCGQSAQPYPDPERYPRLIGADGGFLLCLKACHAACRTVCHARSRPGAYHREGREVSGNHRPGGYHCV